MTFFLNGQTMPLDHAGTIEELIRQLGVPSETALVEHNGVALHRREWTGRPLRDGDRVEILRVAAGG